MSAPPSHTSLLSSLPDGLRGPLFDHYNTIIRSYRENRWEPAELNAGKLCEVIYTILRGHVDGTFPATPSKPSNMVDACRGLEHAGSTFNRSLKIQIPRMLMALYDIRNNRGVGHTGGDVSPNHMDATVVLYMSKWLMAEIVRLFHNVDTITASAAIDGIVEKISPSVWNIGSVRRVLDTSLSMKERTLLLLYHEDGAVLESEIFSWVEHSNASVFRRGILRSLHKNRLAEYNESERTILLSPKGITYVEENIDLR